MERIYEERRQHKNHGLEARLFDGPLRTFRDYISIQDMCVLLKLGTMANKHACWTSGMLQRGWQCFLTHAREHKDLYPPIHFFSASMMIAHLLLSSPPVLPIKVGLS